MSMRVGQGLDAHRFGDGDHVILGGVRIPHDRGLVAHSDGDVALHALCDAMLGAAALGDIGRHFPPGDDRWAGADSRDLVRRVRVKLGEQGWLVVNADLTVVCESPRVGAHVESMRANIAADLEVDRQRVSVKATTTEGLGFCGRGEGIAASAIVLLGPR
jgi:2-C-methyl-D-erythritol 2,4-cyclodiphosphate synthase